MLPDATTADAGAVHREIFWPLAQAPAVADSIETKMTRTCRYMVCLSVSKDDCNSDKKDCDGDGLRGEK